MIDLSILLATTRARRAFRPWVIAQLMKQDWGGLRPELVVCAEEQTFTEEEVRLPVRHLAAPYDQLIGVKRNRLLADAQGECSVFLDDDQWLHPERFRIHHEALSAWEEPVPWVALTGWRVLDLETGKVAVLANYERRAVPGTTLGLTKVLRAHRFAEDRHRASELAWWESLNAKSRGLSLRRLPPLRMALHHGGNVNADVLASLRYQHAPPEGLLSEEDRIGLSVLRARLAAEREEGW